MSFYTFSSLECGGLFAHAFAKRLRERGVHYKKDGGAVTVEKDDYDTSALAEAAALAMLEVHRPAEILRLMSLLPYPLRTEGAVFRCALKLAKRRTHEEAITKGVREYLEENEVFHADGFLRFRMSEVIEDWAEDVDKAGIEIASGIEYAELMRLILFAAEERTEGSGGEANLILHPDGSCTVNGRGGVRAEFEIPEKGAIMAMLIGLGPEKLTIYDFSEGNALGLVCSILSVFGERTCIFIGNH